jgi:hypothetical protein
MASARARRRFSRAGRIAVRSSQQRASARHPPPPFLETKKQFRPLPKMRRIFHSGEVLHETGFAEHERYGTARDCPWRLPVSDFALKWVGCGLAD